MNWTILFFLIVISHQTTTSEVRQDSEGGDEDSTTESVTNGHLVGTLAGVLSSLLRAGPNGTSPIKFNFTNAIHRLTNFGLLPGILSTIKHPIPAVYSLNTTGQFETKRRSEDVKTGKKKRLNYRNPSSKIPISQNAISEIETFGENTDQNLPKIKEKSSISTPISLVDYDDLVTPSVVTTTISTTTEDEDSATVYYPPTHSPLEPGSNDGQSSGLGIDNIVNVNHVLNFWGGYLAPAVNIVKGATRNVTFNDVANSTSIGITTAIKIIPTLVETVTNIVNFFQESYGN